MSVYEQAVADIARLLQEAKDANEPEPTAMTLATVDAAGRVSARIVLLKSLDERGFVFHTNRHSNKGRQLQQSKKAALCILWKSLGDGVQVRAEGDVQIIAEAESDAYFASRPRDSQIGAWASLQSQTLDSRATLEARIAEFEGKFEGLAVPRPAHWGGYRLVPDMIEIWFGQRFRLHERARYEKAGDAWSKRALYP